MRIRREMSPTTRALLKVIAPLTTKEERAAREAAIEHLRPELSERYVVFPAQLRIEKPATPKRALKRGVAVLILDYLCQRAIEVVMDGRGRPTATNDLGPYQPSFLREEIQAAERVAAGDARVRAFSKGRRYFVSPFAPEREGQSRSRLVGLRFVAGTARRGISLLGEVVVDLSRGVLVSAKTTRRGEEE